MNGGFRMCVYCEEIKIINDGWFYVDESFLFGEYFEFYA